MINWEKLKSIYFWFNLNQPALTVSTVKLGLIFFGCLLAVGFLCNLMRKVKVKQKIRHEAKLWGSLRGLFSAMGLIGLLLIWFGYEGAYLFSARFWYVIWLAVFLGWFTYIIRDTKKKRPMVSSDNLAWRLKQKYLP